MLFGIQTGTYVKLRFLKTKIFEKDYGNEKKTKEDGKEKFCAKTCEG